MERAEILELIRDSLSLDISEETITDYGDMSRIIRVSLLFEGEVISSETIYV